MAVSTCNPDPSGVSTPDSRVETSVAIGVSGPDSGIETSMTDGSPLPFVMEVARAFARGVIKSGSAPVKSKSPPDESQAPPDANSRGTPPDPRQPPFARIGGPIPANGGFDLQSRPERGFDTGLSSGDVGCDRCFGSGLWNRNLHDGRQSAAVRHGGCAGVRPRSNKIRIRTRRISIPTRPEPGLVSDGLSRYFDLPNTR